MHSPPCDTMGEAVTPDGASSFLTDRPEAMKERFIFNRIEIELPGPWHDLFSFSLIRSGRACARLSQETKIDDITDRDFRRDQGANAGGGRHYNELDLESFLLKEAFIDCQCRHHRPDADPR